MVLSQCLSYKHPYVRGFMNTFFLFIFCCFEWIWAIIPLRGYKIFYLNKIIPEIVKYKKWVIKTSCGVLCPWLGLTLSRPRISFLGYTRPWPLSVGIFNKTRWHHSRLRMPCCWRYVSYIIPLICPADKLLPNPFSVQVAAFFSQQAVIVKTRELNTPLLLSSPYNQDTSSNSSSTMCARVCISFQWWLHHGRSVNATRGQVSQIL